mmetsp:Transcript_7623/g.9972  ORF Transcript_7623/g.9972 Transcript_7623/m.9972 type:complete len:341 (-) Transcript_7623:369-1391(-)
MSLSLAGSKLLPCALHGRHYTVIGHQDARGTDNDALEAALEQTESLDTMASLSFTDEPADEVDTNTSLTTTDAAGEQESSPIALDNKLLVTDFDKEPEETPELERAHLSMLAKEESASSMNDDEDQSNVRPPHLRGKLSSLASFGDSTKDKQEEVNGTVDVDQPESASLSDQSSPRMHEEDSVTSAKEDGNAEALSDASPPPLRENVSSLVSVGEDSRKPLQGYWWVPVTVALLSISSFTGGYLSFLTGSIVPVELCTTIMALLALSLGPWLASQTKSDKFSYEQATCFAGMLALILAWCLSFVLGIQESKKTSTEMFETSVKGDSSFDKEHKGFLQSNP